MKVYCSRGNDRDLIDKLVGTDQWIKSWSMTNGGEYYIRYLSKENDYYLINHLYCDWIDDGTYEVPEFLQEELSKVYRDYRHFRVSYPISIYTTEELLENIKNLDSE